LRWLRRLTALRKLRRSSQAQRARRPLLNQLSALALHPS
jgi:hypothetical protein